MAPRANSRQKILNAAAELTRIAGSAHLSLDAVAARAGVSKGGLLYNFPNKNALLKALVQQHVDHFRAVLKENSQKRDGQPVGGEYFERALEEVHCEAPAGLLAAAAEDPEFLKPVGEFNRDLLDVIAEKPNCDELVLAFLALEGLRAQRLLGVDVLTSEERERVLASLKQILKAI